MKLICRTILVLFIFAGLASCDDETIGERYGDGPNLNAQFRVDINGETFVADQYGILTTEDGITEIIGKRNDGARVRMKVAGAGEDSYILNGTTDGSAYYYDGVNEDPYDMIGVDTIGILTITKYETTNGLSSGTFSFRAYRENSTIIDTTDTPETDSTETPPTPTPGLGLPDTLEFTNGSFTDIPLNYQGEDPDPPGEITSNFHVELDGELYEADDISAHYTENDGLTINAQTASEHFALRIFDTNNTTISLGGDNPEGSIQYFVSSTDEETAYEATEGNITISDMDFDNNLATGTFTGILTDTENPENTIEMTNGVFEDIQFQSEISGDSFMLANIDGNNFNFNEIISEDAGSGLINVIGTDSANNQLKIILPSSVNIGSFQVSNAASFSAVYYQFDTESGITTEYTSVLNSGSIVITNRQGTLLTGTFTFSVRNDAGEVYQVTQGEFKADIAL